MALELLLLPGGAPAASLSVLVRRGRAGRAAGSGSRSRCPRASALSVNLVSHAHVDLPFANDERIGVVDHVFADDALRTVAENSAPSCTPRSFDERRLHLH